MPDEKSGGTGREWNGKLRGRKGIVKEVEKVRSVLRKERESRGGGITKGVGRYDRKVTGRRGLVKEIGNREKRRGGYVFLHVSGDLE